MVYSSLEVNSLVEKPKRKQRKYDIDSNAHRDVKKSPQDNQLDVFAEIHFLKVVYVDKHVDEKGNKRHDAHNSSVRKGAEGDVVAKP